MQGADDRNIQRGGFFQKLLYHVAVFADDVEVVAARLAVPVLVGGKRAEFAERVGGKEDLVLRLVGNHHFWPVHHGRENEGERAFAQRKRFAVLHGNAAREDVAEKPFGDGEGLLIAHDGGFGVFFQKRRDRGGMVRLHVVQHEIIGLFSAEFPPEVCEPFLRFASVHGVRYRDLFIKNHVGIITYPVGDGVLAFEEVQSRVVDADVAHAVCDFHVCSPYTFRIFYSIPHNRRAVKGFRNEKTARAFEKRGQHRFCREYF